MKPISGAAGHFPGWPAGVSLLVQAFLLATAIVLAGMVAAYFENLEEYSFSLFQLAPWLVMLWLLATVILFAVAGLVTWLLPSARYWLLPALAVLLWAQGPYNLPDYGPLDGTAVDWSEFGWYYLRDALFIGVVAALFVFFRESLRRHVFTVLGAILTIQVLSAGVAAWQAEGMPRATAPEREIFRLSETDNVFLVILDAYQSDMLKEILAREPDYAERLPGFVYWPNAVGFHPTTYPTIPSLLLGEPYRNSPGFRDYRSRAYSEDSLLHDFREAGYQVDLLKRGGLPPRREGRHLYHNAYRTAHVGMSWRTELEEAVNVFEFALFRHSFQLVRRALYPEGGWVLSSLPYSGYTDVASHRADLTMLAQIRRHVYVQGEQPVFRYIHFITPHLPIVFDADLNPRRAPFTREAFIDQSEAGLRLLLGLVETLQRKGVYDHSRIFVIADHGRPEIGVNNNLFEHLADEQAAPPKSSLGRVMAGGVPLVMTKERQAEGALRIRHEPVYAGDAASSLVDGVSEQGRFAGYSLFTDMPPQDRVRRYYHYHWRDHGWGAEYLAPMSVYEIRGHSWLPSSWHGPLHQLGEEGEILEVAPDDER